MIKLLILKLIVLITIMSCSTSNKNVLVEKQKDLNDSDIEDKIYGEPLPDWVSKSGIENGLVVVVGQAEFSADKSLLYVEKAAAMDAEMKLYSDAPADVRVLAQNSMTGVGIDSGEFFIIQTKLQEIKGITGVKFNEEKKTCRKVKRNGELTSRLTRMCWVQATISVNELAKAYKRTLALKFGEAKAEKFEDYMDSEIKKLTDADKK